MTKNIAIGIGLIIVLLFACSSIVAEPTHQEESISIDRKIEILNKSNISID